MKGLNSAFKIDRKQKAAKQSVSILFNSEKKLNSFNPTAIRDRKQGLLRQLTSLTAMVVYGYRSTMVRNGIICS